MARSTFEGRTAVYQFGCPAKVAVTSDAMIQLHLANDLWNDLVRIYRDHEERVAEGWATHPTVNDTGVRLLEAKSAIAAVFAEIAEAKKTGRSRDAVPVDLRERARVHRVSLREAKADHRAAKGAVYDEMKPLFEALKRDMYAAVKATYAKLVQGEGLYWATYNAVRSSFDIAVSQVSAARKQGRPSDIRFHRWTSEGTWTVQLQREVGDPSRSLSALASGESKWRNQVAFGPVADLADLSRGERRKAARTTISIRVGSEGRDPKWLTLPVVLHRPVPDEADITQVQVSRHRIGTHFRHSVALTCRLPSVDPVDRLGVVAVDLGWRRMPDNTLRVAVWATSEATHLDLPPQVRPWVLRTATGGELRLPERWMSEMRRMSGIQSLRDEKLNALRTELVHWLRDHPQAAEALVPSPTERDPHSTLQVVNWRSAARFAALALRWRDNRQDGDESMFARFEAWRRHDRHLLEWVANTVDQLARSRREVYRVLAARLIAECGTVVLEDMSIPEVTRRGPAEDPDGQQADLARGQARMAAPGQLRQAFRDATARSGATYREAPSEGTTRVHAVCGTWFDQDTAAQVMLWCPACCCPFDQDENAALNLLRLASGEVESLARASARLANPQVDGLAARQGASTDTPTYLDNSALAETSIVPGEDR